MPGLITLCYLVTINTHWRDYWIDDCYKCNCCLSCSSQNPVDHYICNPSSFVFQHSFDLFFFPLSCIFLVFCKTASTIFRSWDSFSLGIPSELVKVQVHTLPFYKYVYKGYVSVHIYLFKHKEKILADENRENIKVVG